MKSEITWALAQSAFCLVIHINKIYSVIGCRKQAFEYVNLLGMCLFSIGV